MPNWCTDQVVFISNNVANLLKLEQDLDDALRLIDEGDETWIGRLLRYKGADVINTYCRGFIYYASDKEEVEETELFSLNVNSAWEPLIDVYNWMAEHYDLEYVLTAEEPGCGIYINTDVEGNIFGDRYYVEHDDLDYNYFETLDEVINALQSIQIPAKLGMTLEELNRLDEDMSVQEFKKSFDC